MTKKLSIGTAFLFCVLGAFTLLPVFHIWYTVPISFWNTGNQLPVAGAIIIVMLSIWGAVVCLKSGMKNNLQKDHESSSAGFELALIAAIIILLIYVGVAIILGARSKWSLHLSVWGWLAIVLTVLVSGLCGFIPFVINKECNTVKEYQVYSTAKEKTAIRAARICDGLLDKAVLFLIVCLLAFGAYSMYDIYSTMHAAELPDTIVRYKPKVVEAEEEQPNELTFQELQAINPDTIAWLTINGTDIDFPIVQGEDNSEYLNKAVTGEPSISGAIFLDYRNKEDFTDQYNIVYGHNMANAKMFGCVPPMAEKSGFANADEGWLFLPQTTYKIRVMACINTNAGNMEIYDIENNKTRNIREFVTYLRDNADQYRDLSMCPGSRYIVLSTCTQAEVNGRCLLIIKILDKS